MSRVAVHPAAHAALGYEPVADLNITPLIDVLLVLIVMFILCLPIATNELPIDLPQGSTTRSDAPVHRLAVTRAGGLLWDGAAVEEAALAGRLAAVAAAGEALTLAPDPQARYARIDGVVAQIKRAGVTRLGFEGNERFARW